MRSIIVHFRYGLCFGLLFFEPTVWAISTQNEVAKKVEKSQFCSVSAWPRSQRPLKIDLIFISLIDKSLFFLSKIPEKIARNLILVF